MSTADDIRARLAARRAETATTNPNPPAPQPAAAAPSEKQALTVAQQITSRLEAEGVRKPNAGTAINPPMEYQPPMTAEELNAKENSPTRDEAGEKIKTSKKGRPTGSKNKPKENTAPCDNPVEAAGMSAASEVEETGVLALPESGFCLFVDCLPLGSACTPAEAIFAKVHEHIMETKQIADYRYVEFGKGAAMWVEALREFVKQGLVMGPIHLITGTPEATLAMSVLMPAAAFVVRGCK